MQRGLKMVYIESGSCDPRFNLALEQYLFERTDNEEEYFMLWQNDKTVVVGRYQNTIAEVNQDYIDKNAITVVRRISGGGAVYHDLGNLNFSYIVNSSEAEKLDFSIFAHPVIKALAGFGIRAELQGRNDISINGSKISGNAQYIKGGRVLHHGTILYSSDISAVSAALKISGDKLESKGVKSVRRRVTNVHEHMPCETSLEDFKQSIKNEVFSGRDVTEYLLTQSDINIVTEIQQSRYNRWEWNYGESPPYSIYKRRRVENCGEIEIYMDVKEGIIHKAGIRGDFFSNGEIGEFEDRLVGCKVNCSDLTEAIKGINIDEYIHNLTTDEFLKIVVG